MRCIENSKAYDENEDMHLVLRGCSASNKDQPATYDAYGNVYAQPQVQTSVHQAAVVAYGAYPPTYTVQQSYPHQTYVQATTPKTLAPAQQPAAAIAPQAYYGSYKNKL
ncbi:hypothetical protein POM88_022329 [Heracleum sosnowskyi]|uniref:Uncharacterized protein n=1 Tax=Heracleum sosnowskyi TaxID=360622 RepID=A0AAD8IF19_9APIA|nr:hypothetical protein POM88_022329 [Heracleum sosnowskyi]